MTFTNFFKVLIQYTMILTYFFKVLKSFNRIHQGFYRLFKSLNRIHYNFYRIFKSYNPIHHDFYGLCNSMKIIKNRNPIHPRTLFGGIETKIEKKNDLIRQLGIIYVYRKKKGGLAFKKLHLHNVSLIAKQTWRLLSKPHSG